jgi:hypothetical protein
MGFFLIYFVARRPSRAPLVHRASSSRGIASSTITVTAPPISDNDKHSENNNPGDSDSETSGTELQVV